MIVNEYEGKYINHPNNPMFTPKIQYKKCSCGTVLNMYTAVKINGVIQCKNCMIENLPFDEYTQLAIEYVENSECFKEWIADYISEPITEDEIYTGLNDD